MSKAMARMLGRPWTTREDRFLRVSFPAPSWSVAAIAGRLQRTERAVRLRVRRLGLARPSRKCLPRKRCGRCQKWVYPRSMHDANLEHHFCSQKHRALWMRQQGDQGYPSDAPGGSLKRQTLAALRQKIAEAGSGRKLERSVGLHQRNVLNYYARGDWKYLTDDMIATLQTVIPDAIDPADPRWEAEGLRDTRAVREGMGERGSVALAAWRKGHPRKWNRVKRAMSEERLGTPNPRTAAGKRAEWDAASPEKTATFLAHVRRRRHLPTEQIRRAWKRTGARCARHGRSPTEEDIQDCVRRQASDLDLPREVVRLFVDQARGAPLGPGRLPDIDLYVTVRDIRRSRPHVEWDEIAEEIGTWLGLAVDSVKPQFFKTKRRLGLTRTTLA